MVQEAVSRAAGGYAGLFAPAERRIEVAYWADPLVVLHEAAHGWFNGGLVADRWASEGFASLYAQRAAGKLKVRDTSPKLTAAVGKAAIPLNAWPNTAGDDGGADLPTETYGYAASLALARAIAARAGDDALQRVWAAASARVGAYQPETAGGVRRRRRSRDGRRPARLARPARPARDRDRQGLHRPVAQVGDPPRGGGAARRPRRRADRVRPDARARRRLAAPARASATPCARGSSTRPGSSWPTRGPSSRSAARSSRSPLVAR